MIDLDKLSEEIHDTAIIKGFWPLMPQPNAIGARIDGDRVGAKLALIHSEVTEVLEAYRKSQSAHKIASEFADILIRTLDLYAAMTAAGMVTDLIEDAILEKMQINSGRPMMHGNVWG